MTSTASSTTRSGPPTAASTGVNATVSATDPTIDCTANPLWIQTVAAVWGLVFPQCNIGTPVPTDTGVVTRLAPVVDPQSRIRAALGARTADLAAQIDAQVADSPIRDGNVATVLVGLYDVLAEYAQYPAVGEPQLIANLTAEGAALGLQVNRLADLGARVIVSTVPDIAFSPFSLAERASHVDTDRAVLIQRLVDAFNTSFRNTIVNDGRQIGLVLLDNFVEAVARNPSLNNFGNVVTGVCDLDQSLLTPPSTLDCNAAHRSCLVATPRPSCGPMACTCRRADRYRSATWRRRGRATTRSSWASRSVLYIQNMERCERAAILRATCSLVLLPMSAMGSQVERRFATQSGSSPGRTQRSRAKIPVGLRTSGSTHYWRKAPARWSFKPGLGDSLVLALTPERNHQVFGEPGPRRTAGPLAAGQPRREDFHRCCRKPIVMEFGLASSSACDLHPM